MKGDGPRRIGQANRARVQATLEAAGWRSACELAEGGWQLEPLGLCRRSVSRHLAALEAAGVAVSLGGRTRGRRWNATPETVAYHARRRSAPPESGQQSRPS